MPLTYDDIWEHLVSYAAAFWDVTQFNLAILGKRNSYSAYKKALNCPFLFSSFPLFRVDTRLNFVLVEQHERISTI